MIIIESSLALGVLSHEDAIALSPDDVVLQEVVEEHGCGVVRNISNLLLLSCQLELDLFQPGHFGSDHVLLLELRLLGVDDLSLGASPFRTGL